MHSVEHLNSAPAAAAAAVAAAYYYTIFYVNFVYALYHLVEWLYVGVFVAEKVVAHFSCILLSSSIRFLTLVRSPLFAFFIFAVAAAASAVFALCPVKRKVNCILYEHFRCVATK